MINLIGGWLTLELSSLLQPGFVHLLPWFEVRVRVSRKDRDWSLLGCTLELTKSTARGVLGSTPTNAGFFTFLYFCFMTSKIIWYNALFCKRTKNIFQYKSKFLYFLEDWNCFRNCNVADLISKTWGWWLNVDDWICVSACQEWRS